MSQRVEYTPQIMTIQSFRKSTADQEIQQFSVFSSMNAKNCTSFLIYNETLSLSLLKRWMCMSNMGSNGAKF